MFLNPDLEPEDIAALPVFVVDQVDPETGAFDEHKALAGFSDEDAATDAYLANYEDGWQGLGAISGMPFAAFRSWVMDPKATRRPLALAPVMEAAALSSLSSLAESVSTATSITDIQAAFRRTFSK